MAVTIELSQIRKTDLVFFVISSCVFVKNMHLYPEKVAKNMHLFCK